MRQAVQKLHTFWDLVFDGAPLEVRFPSLRRCLGLVGRGFLAMILTLGRPCGVWNPGGLCLLAASGGGAAGLAALLGVWAGAFADRGFAGGLEPAAAAILIFAGSYLLEETAQKPWFPAAICGVMTALAGLLSFSFTWTSMLQWAALVAAATLGARAFGRLREDRAAALLPAGLLVLGLGTVSLGSSLSLGTVAAVLLGYTAAVRTGSCALAVACGLGLDLGSGTAMTAMLALGAMAAGRTAEQPKALRPAAFLAGCAAGELLWGTGTAAPVLATIPGLLLALPLGLLPRDRTAQPVDPKKVLRRRLEQASATLERLETLVTATHRQRQAREIDLVFDNAASRVCRDCGQWSRCWRDHGSETYQLLSRASRTMLARGTCRPGDFPEAFADGCHRLTAFSAAVDQELQLLLCRRQYRRRMGEQRTVLSQQYQCLASFLRRTAVDLGGEMPEPPVAYTVELGVETGSRGEINGDCCDSFRVGRTHYVLLCDGMGTGREAADEAETALRTLRSLLRAGMTPQEAMELLSGAYLLRESTAFATVDLLAADLGAGDAVLYKWGAAPSYLRRGTVVRKLGTASPPPGLEAGEARQVEGVRLSFKEGEVLVMLSDGAAGAAAERAVAAYAGEAPGEMAAQILAGAAQDAGEADDRTVVTVCLRPCRTGRAAMHETADCSA